MIRVSRFFAKKICPAILLAALLLTIPAATLAQEPDPPPLDLPQPGQPPADQPAPPTEAELGEAVREKTTAAAEDVVDQAGGVIDIVDLAFVAARYGSADPAADINLDGVVNILDLALLARSFNKAAPEAGAAAIPMPPAMPLVEANAGYGAFDLLVTPTEPEVQSQAYVWRQPLRIGMTINYAQSYDATDSTTAPDLYTVARVDGLAARTATIFNQYTVWPNWQLGWWRYTSFPRTAWNAPEANYYTVPVAVELRDDDGRVCYGYYGCRDYYQTLDLSTLLYARVKNYTLYPSSCRLVDENSVTTYGYWLDSYRCRINLSGWGTEWPRGYVSGYLDVQWN